MGFTGVDKFDYEVCSLQSAEGLPGTCDPATVTVTVEALQVAATTTTTVAPTTTVAAAAELPKTGSSSGPLAAVGFLAVLLRGARTGELRRSVTRPQQ